MPAQYHLSDNSAIPTPVLPSGEPEDLHADVIDWEAVRTTPVMEVWQPLACTLACIIVPLDISATHAMQPYLSLDGRTMSRWCHQRAGGRGNTLQRHARDACNTHPGKYSHMPITLEKSLCR